jgi:hypothetical protein
VIDITSKIKYVSYIVRFKRSSFTKVKKKNPATKKNLILLFAVYLPAFLISKLNSGSREVLSPN